MSKVKSVTFETQLASMRILANGAISMTIKTPTLNIDDNGELIKDMHNLNNVVVAVALVPVNDKDAEVVDIPSTPTKKKYTQSQYIKFALKGAWERAGENGSFEDYYNEKTDRIIKKIKEL